MQDFTQLKVWQKAHSFTVNLYKISSEFPSEEKFGLTNQIRRAAISIESNIAEGCGRDSDKEFNRFLSIAKGSCYEVQCQIYIARDLNYMSHQKCDLIVSKIDEILKMIYSLQKKLEARS
jgi:four helix bundle protein